MNLDFESRDLIKNSALVITANYAGAAVLFLANILLANRFGPRDFGIFKTVINLFSFLPVLIDLGIGLTLAKYIAQLKDERANILIVSLLKLIFCLYLCSAGIILIFNKYFAIHFLKDYSLNYLIFAGLVLFIFFSFDIFKHIIAGFQEFKLYAFSQLLTMGSIGVCTFILGYYFGIYYAVIGWGLGYLLGNIVNIGFLNRRNIFRETRKDLDVRKIFLGYSVPIYLMSLPGLLGLAVIPILSLFLKQKLIGYLAFAMIFYQGIITIPVVFSVVLFPKLSKLSQSRQALKNLAKQAFYIYTPIFLIGSLLCLMFSNPFIKTFFPKYLSGLAIFRCLIYFGLISGYILIYRAYLSVLAKFKTLAFVTFFQNLSLLVLSFIVLNYLTS